MATPEAVITAAFPSWQRVPEIVSIARDQSLDLASACTLMEKESNTRNVFGHDAVDTGGNYVKGEPVTKTKYLAYKAWRDEPNRRSKGLPSRMQGVGPLQLTWWSYQDQADAEGGCWDWAVNTRVGFRIFVGHLRSFQGDVWKAARAYNGKDSYADDFMVKRKAWQDRLTAATEPPPPPVPPAPVPVPEWLRLFVAWLKGRLR